jgi:hypothetical protein
MLTTVRQSSVGSEGKGKIINREMYIDFFSDRNPRLYAIDFVQFYCERVLVTAVYLSPKLLLCAYTSSHNLLTLVIHTDIPLCFSYVGSVLSLSCRVLSFPAASTFNICLLYNSYPSHASITVLSCTYPFH